MLNTQGFVSKVVSTNSIIWEVKPKIKVDQSGSVCKHLFNYFMKPYTKAVYWAPSSANHSPLLFSS